MLGWGLVAAAALPLGAAAGWFLHLPQRAVAGTMAFGSGALIAALSIVLMQDAYDAAGFPSTAASFLAGALAYTFTDTALQRWGRRRRRARSEADAHALALAAGSALDNIPEMIVLGIGFSGGVPSMAMLAAIFVSNVPEALSSAAELKRAGRSAAFVFVLWCAIGALAAAATLVGYLAFGGAAPEVAAAAKALAAGAIIAMVADSMIPQAYEVAHDFSGLITALGFLLAFALQQLQR